MRASGQQKPTLTEARIVLTDPTLFGNDAAEDEREDIFYSYALEREEVGAFADPYRPLCIARAYKGEGKSALLRLTKRKVSNEASEPVQVARTASELAPEVARDDYSSWVRGWKASILNAFAIEIGSQIGVAWSDDAMSLVEESEKAGFRRRSLVSSILNRFKMPEISLAGEKISLPERRVLGTTNPGEAVKRWSKGKAQLWLFVDDVDKNFESTRPQKLRVASFFDACRELVNAVPELRIRAVIRPNIWTILRLEFESLSHIQQYLHDLTWSEEQARQLLSKRIEAYLKRTNQWRLFRDSLRGPYDERQKATIATVFESPMPWGGRGKQRPPHSVLYTLSKRRPRWIVELAKMAAASAVRQRHSKIRRDDIFGELASFGLRRIEDTVAEFKPQCAELDELIAAFNREKEQMTTAELLGVIDNKILSHLTPIIAGISGKPTNLNVAAFLFEIGLFYGRRDFEDGSYEHIAFSDRPSLLRARTNIDAGLSWEVHPVYRQALEIRDPTGRPRSGGGRRRRD